MGAGLPVRGSSRVPFVKGTRGTLGTLGIECSIPSCKVVTLRSAVSHLRMQVVSHSAECSSESSADATSKEYVVVRSSFSSGSKASRRNSSTARL